MIKNLDLQNKVYREMRSIIFDVLTTKDVIRYDDKEITREDSMQFDTDKSILNVEFRITQWVESRDGLRRKEDEYRDLVKGIVRRFTNLTKYKSNHCIFTPIFDDTIDKRYTQEGYTYINRSFKASFKVKKVA